jgi:metallo-beta-lactamase family protein
LGHAGRIPFLLAAGYQGPIYCSPLTAELLVPSLEEAVKSGMPLDTDLMRRGMAVIPDRVVAVPYNTWIDIPLAGDKTGLRVRFSPAGHMPGSAYIECEVRKNGQPACVLFSGDLGMPHSPHGADTLVLESTYGDQCHESSQKRRGQLTFLIRQCFERQGTLLIPVSCIGLAQELLHELEQSVHRVVRHYSEGGLGWKHLEFIVDSPMAGAFEGLRGKLKSLSSSETQTSRGQDPFSFEHVSLVSSHRDHRHTLEYLHRSPRPSIVLAESHMCDSGRMVRYLKTMLPNSRHQVLLVGCQAVGTPGYVIQRQNMGSGEVTLDGACIPVRASVSTLSGFSAHADRKHLLAFVERMKEKPREIHLVHGSAQAKAMLRNDLEEAFPQTRIVDPLSAS